MGHDTTLDDVISLLHKVNRIYDPNTKTYDSKKLKSIKERHELCIEVLCKLLKLSKPEKDDVELTQIKEKVNSLKKNEGNEKELVSKVNEYLKKPKDLAKELQNETNLGQFIEKLLKHSILVDCCRQMLGEINPEEKAEQKEKKPKNDETSSTTSSKVSTVTNK